jgi:hypothetical protein
MPFDRRRGALPAAASRGGDAAAAAAGADGAHRRRRPDRALRAAARAGAGGSPRASTRSSAAWPRWSTVWSRPPACCSRRPRPRRGERSLAQQSSNQAASLQEISATMEEVRGQATAAADHARRVGEDSRGTTRGLRARAARTGTAGRRHRRHPARFRRGREGDGRDRPDRAADQHAGAERRGRGVARRRRRSRVRRRRRGGAGPGAAQRVVGERQFAPDRRCACVGAGRWGVAAQVASVFGDVLDGAAKKVDAWWPRSSASSGRQQDSIQTVGQSLHTIDGTVQDNARRAEELAQVVRSSRELVELLRVAVGRFRFEQSAAGDPRADAVAPTRRAGATFVEPNARPRESALRAWGAENRHEAGAGWPCWASSQRRNACRAGRFGARGRVGEPVRLAGAARASRERLDHAAAGELLVAGERRQHGDAEAGDRGLQHHLVVFEARPAAAVDAGHARLLPASR